MSTWLRSRLSVRRERHFDPEPEGHIPWSRPSFARASVLLVEGGAVRLERICDEIGGSENRFGREESGRRAVALDGAGDFGHAGCRERIDGGER
jgi:hypothetical protein